MEGLQRDITKGMRGILIDWLVEVVILIILFGVLLVSVYDLFKYVHKMVSDHSPLASHRQGFFYRSQSGNRTQKTAAVNRKYRAVYRDRLFCCVGISGLPNGFYYRSTAVRTVTMV
jgi:hypothetical protein